MNARSQNDFDSKCLTMLITPIKTVGVRALSRDLNWCHIQSLVGHLKKEENIQHVDHCSFRSSCFAACLKKSANARSRKLGARNCWPEAKTGFSRSRKGNRKVSCALRSLVPTCAVSCHNLDSFCTEDVADHSAEVPPFEIGRENQNIDATTPLTQTQSSLCSVDQSLTRSQSLKKPHSLLKQMQTSDSLCSMLKLLLGQTTTSQCPHHPIRFGIHLEHQIGMQTTFSCQSASVCSKTLAHFMPCHAQKQKRW